MLTIPESQVRLTDDGYACERCGKVHPRITQILDTCVPKYALVAWAYKIGREGGDIEKERDAGGQRGTELHEYLSEYITSGTLPPVSGLRESARPYGVQLGLFLQHYEPEFLASEVPVVSHELDFAGTTDGFAVIHKQPARRNKPVNLEGKRVLFDLKTSRDGRVYAPAHFLQVAAYSYAWCEMEGEPENEQIIVAVGEGQYQVAVNYFDPIGTEDLLGYYHMLQDAKASNPNKRENKNGSGN